MSSLEAILLGIVQGATEFLPISSSGHLLLVPRLLGLPEPDLKAVAIAHLGTLLAVLLYFRKELLSIAVAMLTGLRHRQYLGSDEARLGWYIVAGTIPAVVAGLLLGNELEKAFGQPAFAAALLLGTALILLVGERRLTGRKPLAEMTWVDALGIGLGQMLALLPGISRSGVTISTGIVRGLDRASAARFSFLLGVPAIAGAGALSLLELVQEGGLAERALDLTLAFAAAAFVGYLCIHFLLTWLRQHTLYPFALYCAIVGTFFLLFGLR